MAFRKAQIEIVSGHTITVDAEDADRVQSRKWQSLPGEQPNTARFFTNINSDAQPVYQLLAGFILGVKPNQFVEQIDRGTTGTLDYRKKNLKVR